MKDKTKLNVSAVRFPSENCSVYLICYRIGIFECRMHARRQKLSKYELRFLCSILIRVHTDRAVVFDLSLFDVWCDRCFVVLLLKHRLSRQSATKCGKKATRTRVFIIHIMFVISADGCNHLLLSVLSCLVLPCFVFVQALDFHQNKLRTHPIGCEQQR